MVEDDIISKSLISRFLDERLQIFLISTVPPFDSNSSKFFQQDFDSNHYHGHGRVVLAPFGGVAFSQRQIGFIHFDLCGANHVRA